MAAQEAELGPGHVTELIQGGAVLREHQAEHDTGGSYAAAERAMGEDWEDLGDWEMFLRRIWSLFSAGSFLLNGAGCREYDRCILAG
jgi:hypothetical protein